MTAINNGFIEQKFTRQLCYCTELFLDENHEPYALKVSAAAIEVHK